MKEEWRPCLEGVYEASCEGRIRRVVSAPGARVGRILRSRPNLHGYEIVTVSIDGAVRTVQVHVAVAAAFLGPRPAGMDVNHRNGNKRDNRLVNLEYVTRSENHKHAFRSGLRPAVGRKLTDSEVRKIRRRHAAGEKMVNLAKVYGVSPSLVSMVVSRQRWSHVA